MNRAYVVAMGAIALGLTLQTPLVRADEATAKGDAAQVAPDAQAQPGMPRTKHAPTAQMDQATPPGKSAKDRSANTKHPPTAQMDRAVPDERSPRTGDKNAPGADDKQSPGTASHAQ